MAAELAIHHSVRLIAAKGPGGLGAERRPLSRVASAFHLWRAGAPIQLAIFDGLDVANRVLTECESWKPDVVVVVTERLPFTTRALSGYPLVLDLVDSMTLHMKQRRQRAHPLLRWVWTREVRGFQRCATQFRAETRGIVSASATAREEYPEVVVIPNGATAASSTDSKIYDVGFTGSLRYWPNVQAVLELCEHIVPAIRREFPGVRAVIAGRRPTSKVRRACDAAKVSLLADVPDMAEVLGSIRLALAPVRWTSGANLKILEALAVGTPVVTYAPAMEQLPAHLAGVLVSGGPDDMARIAVAVLRGEMPVPVPNREAQTWRESGASLRALVEAVAIGPATV
jgi:glycosyltransferase involved in cell wall biosynthesis